MSNLKKESLLQPVSLSRFPALNAGSPLPLYFQLCEIVEKKIQSGDWPPGQMLPSEQMFCTAFQISRTVVRQAFSELERKGLLKKRNGKKTTVAFPSYIGALMENLLGFHEDTLSRGQTTSTRVLELRVIPAKGDVARNLRIEEGKQVIMLNRLRFLNDEPEVLVVTYLPYQRCPGLMDEDFTKTSLYKVLESKYHLSIVSGSRTIRAIATSKKDAKLLGVKLGSPALLLSSVGLLPDGSVLEYFVAKHRGDRSEFKVNLGRNPSR